MEIIFDGKRRETLVDPSVKIVDSNGKVYLKKALAGEPVLIIPLKPVSGDLKKYTKIARLLHESD